MRKEKMILSLLHFLAFLIVLGGAYFFWNYNPRNILWWIGVILLWVGFGVYEYKVKREMKKTSFKEG